jgi:hypothetical protein
VLRDLIAVAGNDASQAFKWGLSTTVRAPRLVAFSLPAPIFSYKKLRDLQPRSTSSSMV